MSERAADREDDEQISEPAEEELVASSADRAKDREREMEQSGEENAA